MCSSKASAHLDLGAFNPPLIDLAVGKPAIVWAGRALLERLFLNAPHQLRREGARLRTVTSGP